MGHLAWCKECNFLVKVDDCNGHPHCGHCDRVVERCKSCGQISHSYHDNLDYNLVSFGGDWDDDISRDKALKWLSERFDWDMNLTKQKVRERLGYNPWE